MELLAAIGTYSTLKKFVEDDLYSHLGSIQLSAAAQALSSARYANDKKKAYWSCINHLEDAEALYKSQINTGKRDEMCRCYFYVSALKATIFKFLGEEALMGKCCDDSQEIEMHRLHYEKSGIPEGLNWPGMFSLIKLVLSKNEFKVKARRFDPERFWKDLLGRTTSFALPVYSNEKLNPGDVDWDSSF